MLLFLLIPQLHRPPYHINNNIFCFHCIKRWWVTRGMERRMDTFINPGLCPLIPIIGHTERRSTFGMTGNGLAIGLKMHFRDILVNIRDALHINRGQSDDYYLPTSGRWAFRASAEQSKRWKKISIFREWKIFSQIPIIFIYSDLPSRILISMTMLLLMVMLYFSYSCWCTLGIVCLPHP